MQFRDFITQERIIFNMVATTKAEAIAELAQPLFDSGVMAPSVREGVLAALFHREELGTTAVGDGLSVAIPHAKHPSATGLVGVFGRSQVGIPFDSPDGQPVHLFFLLLSNRECAVKHLEALAYISRKCRDVDFRNFLVKAANKTQIVELLDDADNEE